MSKVFDTGKFRIKRGEEYLNRQDFEYWPAWSEHYDFEEIEEIEAWGVDREWALKKFEDYDTGGPHPHYTILDLKTLPLDNMRIFLRAEFEHKNGTKINGYIMNKGDLCITLFAPSNDYIFSCHPMLKKEMEKLKSEAEQDLGLSDLFPLQFTTDFKGNDGVQIKGEFKL